MEIISKELAEVLSKVHLGGLIKETIIHSDERGITIAASDMPDTMYCEVRSNVSLGNTTLGIGDLKMLINYLNGNDNTVDIAVQDNRLTGTKGTVNFKYLLTDPSIIGTAPQEIPEDGLAQVMSLPYRIELTQEMQNEYKRMFTLVKPRAVTVTMGSRGRVILSAGAEASHQFTMAGGMVEVNGDAIDAMAANTEVDFLQVPAKSAPFNEFSAAIMADYLAAVLLALTPAHKAYMYMLPENQGVVILQGGDYWFLKPLVGGSDV